MAKRRRTPTKKGASSVGALALVTLVAGGAALIYFDPFGWRKPKEPAPTSGGTSTGTGTNLQKAGQSVSNALNKQNITTNTIANNSVSQGAKYLNTKQDLINAVSQGANSLNNNGQKLLTNIVSTVTSPKSTLQTAGQGASSALMSFVTLKKGDKGERVKVLQQALQKKGFYKGYAIDGDFGIGTETAVKQWQTKNNYTSNGQLTVSQFSQLLKP
jgi:hypothetical protein